MTANTEETGESIDLEELRELADAPGTQEVLELYGEISGYSRESSTGQFYSPISKRNRTLLSRYSE